MHRTKRCSGSNINNIKNDCAAPRGIVPKISKETPRGAVQPFDIVVYVAARMPFCSVHPP
jgi:hypothetical protein